MTARMPLGEAVAILYHARRRDEVVITSMGTAREWLALGAGALDLVYVPSSMGHATSVALGLALARPDRRVVACTGDGSLLMNLGSLVTITAQRPRNLTVLLFDNGVYEITGAQPTPGAASGRRDEKAVDFAGIARSCGFESVFRFSDAGAFRQAARDAIDASGPTFVILDVGAESDAAAPRSPGPGSERARRFRAALDA
jgi:phosphonopyruvate decarboxylase